MAYGIPRKQFEVWLRNQLFILTERGKCTKIVLRRTTVSSKMGQEVLTIDVPQEDDSPDDNWITDVLTTIEEIAQADADGCGTGTQKYLVQTHHEESNKPSAGFAIRMHADNDEEDIFSEPATKQGLLAQLMRHNEAIMRSTSHMQASVITNMQKTVARQESMINNLVDEKFNNIVVMERLLSNQQERDIENAKAGHKMELQGQIVNKLMLLAPTIVNKLGKGKLLEEKTSPYEQQISSLADTLTEEQLGALQKIFTPDQLLVLIDVFKQSKMKTEKLIEDEQKENTS